MIIIFKKWQKPIFGNRTGKTTPKKKSQKYIIWRTQKLNPLCTRRMHFLINNHCLMQDMNLENKHLLLSLYASTSIIRATISQDDTRVDLSDFHHAIKSALFRKFFSFLFLNVTLYYANRTYLQWTHTVTLVSISNCLNDNVRRSLLQDERHQLKENTRQCS